MVICWLVVWGEKPQHGDRRRYRGELPSRAAVRHALGTGFSGVPHTLYTNRRAICIFAHGRQIALMLHW